MPADGSLPDTFAPTLASATRWLESLEGFPRSALDDRMARIALTALHCGGPPADPAIFRWLVDVMRASRWARERESARLVFERLSVD